jgi:hypothetical protein
MKKEVYMEKDKEKDKEYIPNIFESIIKAQIRLAKLAQENPEFMKQLKEIKKAGTGEILPQTILPSLKDSMKAPPYIEKLIKDKLEPVIEKLDKIEKDIGEIKKKIK